MITKSQPDSEVAARNKAMDRYDSHMNKSGHYSMKGRKSSNQRSPVLDEILRSGQTLVSDYAERMGMPGDVTPTGLATTITGSGGTTYIDNSRETAMNSAPQPGPVTPEEPVTPSPESVTPSALPMPSKHGQHSPTYMKEYRAKLKAKKALAS